MFQLIWNGLFVGSFYALVALGYSMVYGIIKLLNFAHGDLYMLGSFFAFVVLGGVTGLFGIGSIPILLLVLLIAMLLTGGMGVLIERVAYRPLRKSPRLSALITAVGVSFTLEYAVRQIFGASPIDGSSSSSSFGPPTSARPRASICCSPPDRVPPCWVRRSARRGISS
ncbi:hypothetical protein BMH30_06630 [Leucobacter sp. OLES1]|nr:hypothetical protein BMH30_06630 [Leucobacter sp. OLES1]